MTEKCYICKKKEKPKGVDLKEGYHYVCKECFADPKFLDKAIAREGEGEKLFKGELEK